MKSRVCSILNLCTSVTLMLFLVSASALLVRADVTSVMLVDPGIYGEDDDYFTTVWGNPKDMDDTYDLYVLNASCGDSPARAMWTDMSYSDGIWRGTTSDVGELRSLYVLNPGWVSSLDMGEDGELYPIDPNQYTQLTFRMRVANGAGYDFQSIHWADSPIGAALPRGSRLFQIQSDGQWHIYTFDLTSDAAWTSGPVSSLWLHLANLNAGYLVEIDWIRLTPAQSYQIMWNGYSLSGMAKVYLGSDPSHPEQYGDLLIYDGSTPREIDASARTLSIPASLPGGTYYARVEAGASGATSLRSWTFKEMPIAEIVDPSYTSGEDFATAVIGNPWDMDGTDDIDTDPTKTEGVKSLSASNGVLTIVSDDDGMDSCAEPWPHRPLAFNLGGHTIDTSKFKYFSYRYKVDDAPEQGAGGVTRVRWQAQGLPYWPTGRTDDISLYDNGWHTYSMDLSNVTREGELGEWNFPVDVMQIMIHESHREWTSHLDWVKLTTENVAGSSYTVRWNLVNVSEVLTTTIYWAEKNGSNYNLVPGTGHVVPGRTEPVSHTLPYDHNLFLPAVLRGYDPASTVQFQYEVSTAGLVSGNDYYVAIKLEDGYTVAWWYSEVPVKKQ